MTSDQSNNSNQTESDDANNNAADGLSASPVSTLPRTISQHSQRPLSNKSQQSISTAEDSAVSRQSSPTNIRPDSFKSHVSRDSSSALSFSVSPRKAKSKVTAADQHNKHQVTFTVTIAAAVPAVIDDDNDKNKSKRVVSDPKAQAFYHIEYYLLPTDVDPNKIDVTLFGIAAKIYPEKQDAKVMKTWTEGHRTWIAWAHSHTINITSDLLKKLCYHKLVVRIWDTKDRFSAKARFDRPRAFKFPPPKPGEDLDDISGVKTLISRLCKALQKRLPKNSHERLFPQCLMGDSDKKKEQQSNGDGVETHTPSNSVPSLLLGHPDIEYRVYAKLVELAHLDSQVVDKKLLQKALEEEKGQEEADAEERRNSPARNQRSASSLPKQKRTSRDRKAEQLIKEANEYSKKHGVCSIHVPLGRLFVAKSEGQRICLSRLETPVKHVLDAFVSVAIDKDLLTDELRTELNPMSIKLKSVKNMPEHPLPYAELRKKCHPCTMSYEFFGHEVHKTKGQPQAKNIYWDDLNVILLGTLPRPLLLEYILGAPMEIQVHDRDKLPGTSCSTAALFGHDGEDSKINNIGYISGRRTHYNALTDRPASWDPYGIAKLNMSDLLLGQKIINVQIPIQNCPLPDILGWSTDAGKVVGIPSSIDGPSEPPMAPGLFVDSHTMIKVRLEVAVPLLSPEEVASRPSIPMTNECPFGRIVYTFDHRHRTLARDLLTLTSEINAIGLGLDNLSPMVLDAALSTYKLSVEQQLRKDLDIITGFQVMDGKSFTFILEGMKDRAIRSIWEKMVKPREGVQVLYNSDMSFSERLYGTLDVDLTRVKLHEPLDLIVRQPLLYVRDMVPRDCFEALRKLNELKKSTCLTMAVRNELFPTASQVISMSREFGVPLTSDDLITDSEKVAAEELLRLEKKSKSAIPANATARMSRSRMQLKEPLDMSNDRYLDTLKSRQKTADYDYVADNIRTVLLESRMNKLRNKPKATEQSGESMVHNYSIQTFNSSELAKEKLRNQLRQDTLYSYNPNFHHSGSFEPVNMEQLMKNEKEAHKKKFVSKKNWSYPGVETLVQCNTHPRKPDQARVDALREEWQENLNHKNKLNPTLEEKETYPWIDRKEDMDVWTYPAKHFEPFPEPPLSIMLPGVRLQNEKNEAADNETEDWKKKVVTNDESMHFYRCNPQTEAIFKGPKASNELSKLENLLRDPPKKYAMAKIRSDIPPLRVVHYPSVDTKARAAGIDVDKLNRDLMGAEKSLAFHPGENDIRGWNMESNRIPTTEYDHARNGYFNVYHNTEHSKPSYRKHINPLTETEYNSYLFMDPGCTTR